MTAREESTDLTALLQASARGDLEARNQAFKLVYEDLKIIARRVARSAGRQDTLDTTGLVHESYLRLMGSETRDRGHFFALAARAMRQVVCDHARRRVAAKRGGGGHPLALDEEAVGVPAEVEHLLQVDDLLDKLGQEHERAARALECKVFGGFTAEETGEALGVSVRTVHLDLDRARAWLSARLSEGAPRTARPPPMTSPE
ncbi:MAG: sigma-70 family RNA polymerase sigma factor [Deltaproteobacteria bacterium]|nr:sigma-70 family RNA polymerase sigma factor [Deltaproteobacteria bacterium]